MLLAGNVSGVASWLDDAVKLVGFLSAVCQLVILRWGWVITHVRDNLVCLQRGRLELTAGGC